ncbi:MAG: CPBP family intramembrane metalloprotease [Gemmatimonadales bacterium]|nr:CPBP family intramembrane metalloprotease [Gemmatimonadales bacterium]NIN10826.1 CPBP family intramembrane metalloprotease [Gemmatimonadales bacterium]NIN49469.1 CPBP family intramembrane metalloprotease [Gemmatimonadales bacterium]NIP06933.1 CPBP family intramembrane metalloprotease [Gemmatimonadales bacterium]NIR01609.1 CPBP family intramembrane metalloprotease [Gemmatimonadales bacterium]
MFLAVAALLAFYGAVAVIAVAITIVVPASWAAGRYGLLVGVLPVMIAALVVNGVVVARGWSSWRTLGWQGGTRDAASFGLGVGLGVVMAAVALLAAMTLGTARLELTGEPLGAYLSAAAPVGIGLVMAALAEELVFRGYPLVRLAKPIGKVWASMGLALVFAALHLGNPEVSALGLVNIGLASLVLSAAFFTPGGLPAAWGVHLGWNAGLGLGADAPVSGIAFQLPILEFVTGGPSWVTGGAFGPEGGLAATVAMGAALIWLSRRVTGAGKGEPT